MPILIFLKKTNTLKITGRGKGYTIIELAVILSVISILIVFLSTSIPGLISRSGENAPQRIRSAAGFSYRYALVNHSMVVMEIDIEKNSFKIQALVWGENGMEESELYPETSLGEDVVDILDARGYRADTGIVKIPYSYDGTSENFIVHTGHDGNISASVIIEKYHGKVRIVNGETVEF